MPGFEPGDYSMDQIEEARRSIRPTEMLSIASELAVMPQRKEVVSVERSRRKTTLLAYRRAVFRNERAQPKNLSIRDGGKTKKKRRLLKLRHQLPISEDNNLKLSDLFATGTLPVVAQISGSHASSFAMPPMVSESQLSRPLPPVKKIVGYVTQTAELLTKSPIMKDDDKGITTKELRFSVGSKVEPPAIDPSKPNAARNVQHAPYLLPRQLLPPPPTQTYGEAGHSILVPAPAPAPAPALGSVDAVGEGRVDILPQMMALLVKCNELVDAVKPLIGYIQPI